MVFVICSSDLGHRILDIDVFVVLPALAVNGDGMVGMDGTIPVEEVIDGEVVIIQVIHLTRAVGLAACWGIGDGYILLDAEYEIK